MPTWKWTLAIFGALLLLPVPASAERIIVKCERPCSAAAQAVTDAGGTVTFRYKYVDAIAAEVPGSNLALVRRAVAAGAVRKDVTVALPTAARDRDGSALHLEAPVESARALSEAEVAALASDGPQGWRINNTLLNLDPLHSNGLLGQGMKVAVIDSGIRPGFVHLNIDGSVIGGEDLVNDGRGYSNNANGGHGTFVAGLISANVLFNFTGHSWLPAIQANCPTCVTPTNRVALLGSAPSSSIYALRVFGPTGGAPESRIIAAMERVIELRENFDNGMAETADANGKYQALNVKVCNMSLGGPTLYAGRDLEDQLTNAFLEHDIVLVVAASNAGPSGATIGSPGSGFGAITVGAASTAVHERILRYLQYGPVAGALFRPFGGTIMAYFSSRGPSADGRPDIDVVANGFASFGQGTGASTSSISIGSGTSFASPTVAGVAAVLRQAVPGATARQVRNALMEGANPAALADGSTAVDMGRGFVDAAAALAVLQSNAADTPGAEGGTNVNVKVNINQDAGVKTWDGNVTRTATGLLPGQRFETFYRVHQNTAAVVITLSGVQPGTSQNQLFGDDFIVSLHSAKTSSHGEGDYKAFAFTTGGQWVLPRPETGLMRVTLSGDWTNASPISGTINIFSVADPLPGMTDHGKLGDGEYRIVPFTVPTGAATLAARLEWDGDWSSYPTNDLDVVLITPTGTPIYDGASLSSPESASISNPPAGAWLALVDGYTIATNGGDNYKLRIEIDGKVVK